jgi:hypothetical protein
MTARRQTLSRRAILERVRLIGTTSASCDQHSSVSLGLLAGAIAALGLLG